jgi:hypothetical protein
MRGAAPGPRRRGPERAEALALFVRAAVEAADVMKCLGLPTEAWLASERAHQAAIALQDSVMLALAVWSRGHSGEERVAHCGQDPAELVRGSVQ